jgi:hypothetical protein
LAVRQRERRILEAVEPFIERGNRFQKIAKQLEMERAGTQPVFEKPEPEINPNALLAATLALPRYEVLFPERWPETARKVLPSDSPGTSGTAVWAPVLAWSLLHGLPLDGESMFDRLRLRHALADTFHGLGLSGEDGWRAAARVRFLLHRAEPLSRELTRKEWENADVQWLIGTHTAEKVLYFNQESHEELLWWIQVPALVAVPPAQQRTAARESFSAVKQAGQAAQDAGFRLDILLKTGTAVGSDRLKTAVSEKASKRNGVKASTKADSASAQDGAGKSDTDEKATTEKPKKRTPKQPTLRKRKP